MIQPEWLYRVINVFVVVKSKRSANFGTDILLLEDMKIVLITIHKDKDEETLLLVALYEDLKVTDSLAMGVDWEANGFVF
jgi:hypothetical protein